MVYFTLCIVTTLAALGWVLNRDKKTERHRWTMIQFTYNKLTPVLFLTLSLGYNKLEDSKLIFSLLSFLWVEKFALKYEIKINGPITLDAILSPFIVTIYTSLSAAKWKLY